MTPGDKVQVQKPLSGGYYPPPFRFGVMYWCRGYEFVSCSSTVTVVRASSGLWAGCEFNFPPERVRKDQ